MCDRTPCPQRPPVLSLIPLVALWLFSSGTLIAAPSIDSVECLDLAGKTHTPFANSTAKATVLFFLLPDCPNSNAYAPEIKRIAAHYAAHDVVSLIIYVDPDLQPEEARKHASDYGYELPIILDQPRKLVSLTGVTKAPEVAVISPAGKTLYRGRIDNLFVGLGKRRTKVTQHDLRDALDAILKGQPVPREKTEAIGCYISQPVQKSLPTAP